MDKQGILYIALGEEYYWEAVRSLQSLRVYLPNIKVALITDRTDVAPLFDIVLTREASSQGFRDKIFYLNQSPFAETLFLDTDTYICGDFRACFELLERFDIAAAVDVKRMSQALPSVPDCFPEMNTGVLLYKQCPQMPAFFVKWLQNYDEGRAKVPEFHKDDQAAFRDALYHSALKLAILPHAYHVRYLSAGLLSGKAYILHGRPNDQYHEIEAVAKAINRSQQLRAYVAGQVIAYQYGGRFFGGQKALWLASFSHPLWIASLMHLFSSFKKRGFWETLIFVRERFSRYS